MANTYLSKAVSTLGSRRKWVYSTWVKKSLMGGDFIEAQPKKTSQGAGKHTKYSASSGNNAKKRYRGQGR